MGILQWIYVREVCENYFGAVMVWSAPARGSGCDTFQVYGLPPNIMRMGMRSRIKIIRTTTGCSLFFISWFFSIGVE